MASLLIQSEATKIITEQLSQSQMYDLDFIGDRQCLHIELIGRGDRKIAASCLIEYSELKHLKSFLDVHLSNIEE